MNPPKSRENSITHYYIAEENLVGSVKEQNADYDLPWERGRFRYGFINAKK